MKKGQDVLIARKHLHGIHGTVVNSEEKQNVVRINEGQFEGHLVQFHDDDLVPAKKGHLKKHPNDRLDWNRYNEDDLELEPVAAKNDAEGDDE